MADSAETVAADRASCRNCGATLRGEFCHECGQGARDLRTPIGTAAAIFLQQTFGLDGRFWVTFRKLAFFPGRLTEEFLAGKQRRSLHPMRLFLICGVLALLTPDLRNIERLQWPSAWDEPVAADTGLIERFQIGAERLKAWAEDESVPLGQRMAFGAELNRGYLVYILLGTVALAVLAAKLMKPRRLLYDHVIFLLHLASFFYLSDAIIRSLGLRTGYGAYGLALIQGGYTVLSFRRVYAWKTDPVLKGLIVDLALGFGLFFAIDVIAGQLTQLAQLYLVLPPVA